MSVPSRYFSVRESIAVTSCSDEGLKSYAQNMEHDDDQPPYHPTYRADKDVKMLMGMGGERSRFVKKMRSTPRIPLTISPVNEVSPRVRTRKATNAITTMSMISSTKHVVTRNPAPETSSRESAYIRISPAKGDLFTSQLGDSLLFRTEVLSYVLAPYRSGRQDKSEGAVGKPEGRIKK